MKPIETIYPYPNGDRFRSRLEARWAVFFDALGVKYEYEKEGFGLGEAGWYLPDFWLPTQQYWIEIKNSEHDAEAARGKASALATTTHAPVFLFWGLPGAEGGIVEAPDYSAYCQEWYSRRKGVYLIGHNQDYMDYMNTPDLVIAYTAARQARFEHGEQTGIKG